MKIRRLRLQNIKSYQDETLTFYDGVNFISGLNGSGKSTIIESIGYALFDCKPGTLSQFVRYGARTGTITVEFEARDGYLYKVVRKVGSVSSWTVYDGQTGAELDLHGAADIKPWLKDCLGVDQDQDLAQLFSDVIGVSQGTFTAPFLETPANRKQKFNKMLKVETYNEAYLKSREVVAELSRRIAEDEREIARLEERLKEYAEVKGQVEALEPQLRQLAEELAALQGNLRAVLEKRDQLRQTKTQWEQKTQALELLKVEKSNLQQRLHQLREYLAAAQKAAQKLAEAEPGYLAYLQAQKELEQLEKQRREKERLQQHLGRLQQDLMAQEGAWKAGQRAWQEQRQENEQNLAALTRRLTEKRQEVQRAQSHWEEVEGLLGLMNPWQQRLEQLVQDQKLAVQLADRLQDGREKWLVLRQEIKKGEEKLAQEGELKKKLEGQAALEEQLGRKRMELSALTQKLRTLEENRQQTAGGLCPFLQSPCQNVGGDLNRYFAEQIAQTQKELEQAAQEVQRLEGEVAEGKVLTQALRDLEAERLNLQRLSKEEQSYRQAFDRLFQKTLELDLAAKIRRQGEEALALHQRVAGTLGLSSLPGSGDLKRAEQEAIKAWTHYADEVGSLLPIECLDEVEKLLGLLKGALEQVIEFKEAAEEFSREVGSLLTEESKKRNALLGRLTGEQASLAKQQQELLAKREQLERQGQILQQKAQEMEKMRREKGKVEQELEKFASLEQQWACQQGIIRRHQSAYEVYMQHQEEARKVEALQQQIQEEEGQLALKEKTYQDLLQEVQKLARSFREEELAGLEDQVERLKIEVAKKEQLLVERRALLAQQQQKLQALEEAKEQLEQLTAKVKKHVQIRELLEYIRSVFNRAGERIAQVYRKYLAQEANRLYREVAQENVTLEWGDDYEIILADSFQGKKRERTFRQLSGGEQMTAALAVRLALLGQLSGVNLGFFDEPTTNLDSQRRDNLAQVIPRITQGFDQLFIISHDDSFDAMTDNVIELKKDSGQGTKRI